MYFSTTLILLLVVVNILVYCLQKLQHKDNKGDQKPSSSLDKRPMHEEDHVEKNDSSSSLSKQRSMASSSSSQLNTASVSQSWNHEVFLSFRGEDTRKTFVDHLYEALTQKGIETYKDDKTLAPGETVRPALLKAIEESQIAIIVFSENYADSSWCLDELAHIIECKDKIKLIVIPVFYDVDPSDVRKQNGKYGEAFTKHERENKQKVDLWREALVKAGNISGLVPKDFANGHEAQFIKSIVTTISSRLSPIHTNVNKNLIGIKTRVQDLKSMLEIGSDGVRMVGIWGSGGAGKTTLAFSAYMEISRQFEACCFLENIRDESSKHGLTKLQEKFLSLVAKTNEPIGSEMEGSSMIERKLRHKRVLVVLDDINERTQLEALAGSHDWFGEGSRVIITTRDQHLLNLKKAMIYEVSLLSDDEAFKLFSRYAFQKDEPLEDYKKLSQEVVSYAGGLPLALEIIGSFLYDKDKDEWRSVLAKLKRIPSPEVTKKLKISYDGLEPDEKQLFLDITCFYRREKIDKAMLVLDACNYQPRIGIKVLVQKSLIKVSDGRFDMHDLIEEMALYIVRGEHPDNPPEKHSRIWKVEDIDSLYAAGAIAPLMETEVFAIRDSCFILRNGEWINDVEIYLRYGPANPVLIDNNQRVSNVVANMKKLRWLEWHYYMESSLPSNFQPTTLGCLLLKSSQLEQLWEGCKRLPSLKVLDLQSSWFLKKTPDLTGLPCLERLNLEDCKYLKEIHPSIGYHNRLVWVNMKTCCRVEWFPPIKDMIKLETLVLSKCGRLKKFPDIKTRMDSLVNLHMDGTGIELVPPSVWQFFTNLVSFDLRECSQLKQIKGNFRLLKRLKYLKISGCIKLEKVEGDFFGDECCLEELPQFPWLSRKLDLNRCNLGDGGMPSDLSRYINLQVLNLSGNKFSRLPSSLSKIPCLKFLDMSNCENLVELHDLPSSIAILIAEYCKSLQSVGDLSTCKWLWKFSLRGSNKLIGVEKVVHSMVQRNAVEDRFMSMMLPRMPWLDSSWRRSIMTLQLPHNWYNDFSGFLLSADECNKHGSFISIKRETFMDYQPNNHHWEEFVKNPESYKKRGMVGYTPFASLCHTSLWHMLLRRSPCTYITFCISKMSNPKVGLVPRKSKSRETPIHYSECWEEEIGDRKTFQIIDKPEFSEIGILWFPQIGDE